MAVIRSFEFTEETLEALNELAEVTGATQEAEQESEPEHSRWVSFLRRKKAAPIAKVIQDAVRVYEWIIYEQLDGREVISLPREMLESLTAEERVDDTVKRLDPFVEPEKREAAKEYFRRAEAV